MELRDILDRLRAGQSKRAIQRETGTHRTIIRELEELARSRGWLNSPLPAGSGPPSLPVEEELERLWQEGREEQASHQLAPWQDKIREWVDEDLSFVVIHRLVNERHPCSESTVRRYIQSRLSKKTSPVMIRNTLPGKVMDVDFGYLGKLWDHARKASRKAWVFSGRLRHSRKAWREIVFDQSQETFCLCHERAFEHFGGVPEEVVPDNLKAAVIANAWECPLYNRAYRSFARHSGFRICPCLPERPEHKGGVERDIQYIKKNFWALFRMHQKERGREIPWKDEAQPALEKWSDEVADTRKLYGFMATPQELFEEEKDLLGPLPDQPWDQECWSGYTVGADWRIRLDYSWYSVPHQLIDQAVLACATNSLIRVFHKGEVVACHERAVERGTYRRDSAHAPPHKEQYMNQTRQSLLEEARTIGSSTVAVAEKIFAVREVDGMRPVRRLLGLVRKHSAQDLEAACKRALDFETPEYRSVKNILVQGLHRSAPPVEPKVESTPVNSKVPAPSFRFARPLGYFSGKAVSFFTMFTGVFNHG